VALQVERKRHLGNDIVVIIFLDSGTFTPSMIKTKFNRTTRPPFSSLFCVMPVTVMVMAIANVSLPS
jgi:hypothetical protein